MLYFWSQINAKNIKRQKRVCVSINWRSAEYKNLKKFAKSTRSQWFYSIFLSLPFERRNNFYIDAENIDELLGSILYGYLSKVKFVYVGLSGARGIREYLTYQNFSKTIHVSHGRNSSNKFSTYTDAAIIQSNTDDFFVNTAKHFVNKIRATVNYKSGFAIWFHGFSKGEAYSMRTAVNDWRYLNKLRAKYQVIVYPHPSAVWLKRFLLFRGYEEVNLYSEIKLTCEIVFCDSPSMYRNLQLLLSGSGIKLIKGQHVL